MGYSFILVGYCNSSAHSKSKIQWIIFFITLYIYCVALDEKKGNTVVGQPWLLPDKW